MPKICKDKNIFVYPIFEVKFDIELPNWPLGSYSGQVDPISKKATGFGRLTVNNLIYEGQWINNRHSGYGRRIYDAGVLWDGYWENGLSVLK